MELSILCQSFLALKTVEGLLLFQRLKSPASLWSEMHVKTLWKQGNNTQFE